MSALDAVASIYAKKNASKSTSDRSGKSNEDDSLFDKDTLSALNEASKLQFGNLVGKPSSLDSNKTKKDGKSASGITASGKKASTLGGDGLTQTFGAGDASLPLEFKQVQGINVLETSEESKKNYSVSSVSRISKISDEKVKKILSRSQILSIGLESQHTVPLVNEKPKSVKLKDRPDAGKNWYHLPAPELTPELKQELLVLRNRQYIDPKRHYKTTEERAGPLPKYFAIGTVYDSKLDGSVDTVLPVKRRNESLVEQLMHDDKFQTYAKKNVQKVMQRGMSGSRGAYRAMKAKQKGKAGKAALHSFGKKSKK
jgi:Fcf2 pre-rRNA processing